MKCFRKAADFGGVSISTDILTVRFVHLPVQHPVTKTPDLNAALILMNVLVSNWKERRFVYF